VRVARHHRLLFAPCGFQQRPLQRPHRLHQVQQPGAQVHAAVGGHLVIARAGGVQPPAQLRPCALADIGLHIHVDVLKLTPEAQLAGLQILPRALKLSQDRSQVVLADDAALGKHQRVSLAAPDVVGGQRRVGGG